LTRGWLPYSLDWTLTVTESRHPYGFSLDADGDFNGRGIWRFVQDGPRVLLRYDWKIRADKPLLLLSPLRSNLSSKPTIDGPWNAERRASSLSWHDGVLAARTSWPAYSRHLDRQNSRH